MCDPASGVSWAGLTWEAKLAEALYARIARDAALRPLFPGKSHRCAIEAFAAFLVQFFDGPPEQTRKRWYVSLRESHARFRIDEPNRAAWMRCMTLALADADIPEPLRSRLHEVFLHSSGYLVNDAPTSDAPPITDPEMAKRWERQRTFDQAVDAIRTGDTNTATHLANVLGAPVRLLALMVRSRHPILRQYVKEKVSAQPALVHEHAADRTLLQEASSQGDFELVELLLRFGAEANQKGNRPPLYCLANECQGTGGGPVVHLLVRHGAQVNRADNVKRCTALHMAARRGNVEIATALLDCGADIHARDSDGVTPLRRALNCRKPAVAELLVQRGAHHL